jgi:hypothetical protein
MRAVAVVTRHHVADDIEQPVEIGAVRGQGLIQRLKQRFGRSWDDNGPIRQRAVIFRHEIDALAGESAEFIGRQS